MGLFLNKEQSPYQLRRYLVSPSLVRLSDNGKKCDYGRFKSIPDEIIIHIANYLDFFYKTILEKVGKRFFSIIRSKYPPIQYSYTLWSNEEIEDLLKQDSYEFYMKVYKGRNVGPMRYLIARLNKPSPSDSEADPSQWEFIRLKGETSEYAFEQEWSRAVDESWEYYLPKCVNLAFLILRNARGIIDLFIRNLTKLEGLFMEFKSIDLCQTHIILPSSIKTIILYASEGNDQECHTRLSKRYNYRFELETLKGTQLALW
jgi:hypothetical protein